MRVRLLLAFALVCSVAFAQTTPQPPTTASRPEQPLSLQQVIQLALKNNLNIQIEQFNPEISDAEVSIEKARFEPFLAANINTTDATQPTGSFLVGQEAISNKNLDYNFSFNHLLKTGTSYEITFNNSRIRTTQNFTTVNPRYDSTLFATLTQPLLRNFGLEITTAPIRIAEANSRAADQRLRQQMMDVVLLAEQRYWDLVFARRELEVQRQSLLAAQDLYENNKKQVEVGTMAPLEIVVAEAEVAAREEGIIAIETLIGNTEDSLKTVIYSESDAERWTTTVVPADEPVIKELRVSAEDAIRQALANNPDLKALTQDVLSRQLSTRVAANALKPQLDFQASVGYAGLGGRALILDDSFPPRVIDSVPGGYGDALTNLFENQTWSVGFVVGLPLGNRAAEAGLARADLAEKQSKKILENAEEQLILNVRTAMRNLESDLKRLDAARSSRVLQEKKLDAERKKLKVGLSTNHLVLEFQDDLAQAQSAELRAVVAYNKNYATLQRFLGTLIP